MPLLQRRDWLRYADPSSFDGRVRRWNFFMFRGRIPIAILLVLTLPLQSFGAGACCQAGEKSCCSASIDKPDVQAKSCCSRIQTEAEQLGCKHCAAARGKSNQPSLEQCTCQCKKNSHDRPAADQRRQFEFESILASHNSVVAVADPPAPSTLKIDFADWQPELRLHAIHCVWLN